MLLEDINSIIKAAEAGDADAQHKLGFMYEEGRGLPYDEEKATEWYLKAAYENGYNDENDFISVKELIEGISGLLDKL